jgi:hypothetical protein
MSIHEQLVPQTQPAGWAELFAQNAALLQKPGLVVNVLDTGQSFSDLAHEVQKAVAQK